MRLTAVPVVVTLLLSVWCYLPDDIVVWLKCEIGIANVQASAYHLNPDLVPSLQARCTDLERQLGQLTDALKQAQAQLQQAEERQEMGHSELLARCSELDQRLAERTSELQRTQHLLQQAQQDLEEMQEDLEDARQEAADQDEAHAMSAAQHQRAMQGLQCQLDDMLSSKDVARSQVSVWHVIADKCCCMCSAGWGSAHSSQVLERLICCLICI